MIPAPEPSLKVCVVVPAKDEETLIGRCLDSLARQSCVLPEEYEVLLVLDGCTDATGERALQTASRYPDLRLALLEGPGRGAGHARRTGMEAACERLLGLDRPGGLIASTDADTIVAEDWLANQLSAAGRGARAIGGRIELLEEDGPPDEVRSWRDRRGQEKMAQLGSSEDSQIEHWQFSGASLSLTAEAYREIGGLEPRAALEDEYLERALQQRNIPIQRPLDVGVSTSPRLVGRASRGLAKDLSLASWLRRNTYHEPPEGRLQSGCSVSVIAPVQEALENPLPPELDGLELEVIQVPIGGAHAPLSEEFGPVRGRGDALWRGLRAATGEVVALLADGSEESLRCVPALISPLLHSPEVKLVRGYPEDGAPSELSRLVGAPLINLHHPELSGFIDPLSRYTAARRGLLERLPFPVGAGVDASLLLDAARQSGADALAQTALPHCSPATASSGDAYAVFVAMLDRSHAGECDSTAGPLALPSVNGAGLESYRVPVEERPPLQDLQLSAYSRKRDSES